jgi:hypothetical protein
MERVRNDTREAAASAMENLPPHGFVRGAGAFLARLPRECPGCFIHQIERFSRIRENPAPYEKQNAMTTIAASPVSV